MVQKLHLSILGFFCLCILAFNTSAQNNLSLNFKNAASAPQNLTICGDPSEVTLAISLNPNGVNIAKQINATVSLFKGMRFVSFNSSNSSPGVTLINSSDPFKPVFALPDLNQNGFKTAFVSFSIESDCRYLDTLSLNDQLLVKDKWEFNYKDGNNSNLTETDYTSEYRDALKLPFISMTVTNNANKPKVGDIFQREIKISNSGLVGYLKNMTYSNLQGSAISIQTLKINGHNVLFNKVPYPTGDTLISAQIDGNLFIDNTFGIGQPGNGNVLLDPDELVTIEETALFVSCTKNRKSIHGASWGCYNQTCTTIEQFDNVEISQGVIYVNFNPSGSVPDINAGYCQTGSSTVTFTNAGAEVDPGTATMFDVSAGIGLGNDLLTENNGYKIVGLKIAGVSIPFNQITSAVDLNNNPLFTSDPDGPGGFSDADGDGYYDDLPALQSFEITVLYEVDCNFTMTMVNQKFCTNNLTTSFHARLNYSNFCNERTNYTTNSYFGPVNLNDSFEDCSDPDAFTDGTTFYIMHNEIRNVFNFEKNCNGEEQFITTVILPKGVTPVINEISLKRLSEVFPLLNHSQNGDTLFLYFDASLNPFLNGIYTINLAFKADCQAIPGKSIFPINFEFYCPSCDCKHPFYCNNIIGPVIHYNSPPCVPNSLYACHEGLKTLAFDVKRTSLGFKDKNYTIPISPSEANLKAAISCDSIRMNVLNIVGENPISDSIGIEIRYSNVDKTFSPVETFLYDKAKLRITHGGVTYLEDVQKALLTVFNQDSLKLLRFNLHSIIKSLGLTLVANDTIELIANFSLNPDGPYPTPFKKVPNFRAKAYHIVDGIAYNCDDNGETFEIGKTQNGFSYPNSANFPKGCGESYLEYSLIQVNNGYIDVFPNEYRPAAKVDSLEFNYDPLVLDAYTFYQPEVLIPGHPIHGNNYFNMPAFDNSGKYVIHFDTLNYVPSLNVVGSYAFSFRFKAIPNCKALSGSSDGNNRFNFDPTIHYKGRYYANTIGNGSCVDDQHKYVDDDIIYQEPPQLSFTPEGSSNISVVNDTAVWTVRICNTSQNGNAGITWLSLESSVKDFQIISMTDITDPNNLVNLPIKSFGQNNNKYFAFDEGLSSTLNGTATVNDLCNIITIKAKVQDCGSTPFIARAGWNCLPYTEPDWDPEKYKPCSEMILGLAVVSSDPLIDANFVNQNINGEDICDTSQLEILVRNVDLGKAFDVKTSFTIPLTGANFVPGSVEIAYPSNAPFIPALQDPDFVGVSLKGTTYEYTDFSKLNTYLDQNGLDGFDANNPSTTNEFRIRFKYLTDCDFRSGSLAYHSFQGISGCGQPTNIDLGESLPILLNGAVLNPPKSYMVSIDPDSKIVSGGISQIGVIAMNLLNTPSDPSDEISVKLPPGLNYVPGSSVSVLPLGWIIQEPKISLSNGYTILNWPMPSGVGKNGKISLKFSTSAIGIDCNSAPQEIAVETVVEKSLDCALKNTTCNINIITSEGGTNFFYLPVFPPAITINSSATNIKCSGEPIVLVASGASNYIWSDLITGIILGFGDTLKVTPTQLTTYKVEGGVQPCIDSEIITIATTIDIDPPVIINSPGDITILCTDPIPAPAVVDATDDCDTDIDISFKEETIQLDSCIQVIVRTWTAKDDLGNTSTAQQKITRLDTTPPTIIVIDPLVAGHVDGDTIIVDCTNPPVFTADDAIVTDDCDANPTIKFIDLAAFKGNCEDQGYYLLMYCAWSATDHCGNESKIKFYFKFIDNDPPVLHNIPNDITLNQSDPIPGPAGVFATDKCDETPDVNFSENSAKQDCNTIITRKWTGKDDCGNQATATQTITILGQSGPILISGIPNDITILCNDNIPSPANPTATGKCGGNISIVLKETTSQVNLCLKTIVRVWTATDASGATASAQQTISIIDNAAPVISLTDPILSGHVNGDTITLDCKNQHIFSSSDVKATDNCDVNPIVDLKILNSIKANCLINGYKLLVAREWTAKDNCGNSSSIKLYFKYIDNDAPSIIFNNPLLTGHKSGDTISLPCSSQVTFSAGDVLATDACDSKANVVFQDLGGNKINCILVKHLKWIASDSCGNTAGLDLYLKYIDNKAPVLSFNNQLLNGLKSGDTLNLDCASQVTFKASDVSVTDECDLQASAVLQDLGGNNQKCNLVKHLKWLATDNCGNTSSLDLYVKYTDKTAPVLNNVPANIELNFEDIIPPIANVTATDNCDPVVAVTFKQTIDTVGCEVFIKRTWTGTDDCLNTSQATQTIKIKCYICVEPNLSKITVINATCNLNGAVSINLSNPEKFNYTWIPDLGTPSGFGNIRTNIPPGTYSVIVSDKIDEKCNKKATINILKPNCKDTLYLTSFNDINIDTCLNAYIDITPVTSVSICQEDINKATISYNGNSPCIKIVPNAGFSGTTTLCIIYCNGTFCDTTIIILNLKKHEIVPPCLDYLSTSSTVLHPAICAEGAKLCVEIPFAEINKYTITQNGQPYNSGFESCTSNGIPGTSLTFKKGDYKLLFINDKGCKDSINVSVVCTQAAFYYDTVFVSQKKTYKLDQTELKGPGTNIYDITPVPHPEVVLFEPNFNDFGIDYTGKSLGTSLAVISYADELGTFDTAYMYITVIDEIKLLPINAVNDTKTTKKNKLFSFNILDNDTYNKTLNSLELLSQAAHGQISLNNEGLVMYVPDKDYCGKDLFSYRICDITGCDAADVSVDVICKGLVIYNGFSPNGDGKNDYFKIDGIEEFPGNTLKIYNRWGQQVYSISDYDNTWEGTWEGKTLPDGTYYYFLEISDKERYTGYLYIQR